MENGKELLVKAENLASFILERTQIIRETPVGKSSLGSFLSILKLQFDLKNKDVKGVDYDSISPKIYEIILFGSVAEGCENPNDIDLMIFDNGHFSDFCQSFSEKEWPGDMYHNLGDNLSHLMGGWFNVDTEELHTIIGDTEVDLHVLPQKFFQDQKFRESVVEKHEDPDFFENAFGNAMKFNRLTGKFEQLSSDYFKMKCDSSVHEIKFV